MPAANVLIALMFFGGIAVITGILSYLDTYNDKKAGWIACITCTIICALIIIFKVL